MKQSAASSAVTSILLSVSAALLLLAALAHAGSDAGNLGDKTSADKIATVEMKQVMAEGPGDSLGTVTVYRTEYGLLFQPSLESLPPGIHGFHVHEKPSCKSSSEEGDVTPAGAAGGHYDPKKTESHGTPWGSGHKGDLPALYVDQDGVAAHAVLAPRLDEKDLKGRSLMIHANGDNYSDNPEASGGGGPRIACGVFKK
jgi:Cu-Zn family superoxide dismutase